MPLIPHRLHVYQKPAIGDDFQKAYTALNYSHKISAQGGFDNARCSLAVDRNEAENIFRNYLGNRVAVYVDNPVEPIWEGFINRVNLNTGSVQLSASLDKMTNRVLVQWSTGQGRAPAQTAESTDADSIATYGSKMVHIDLGELYTTDTGLPTAVRDAIIAQRYTPPVSAIGAVGQASGLVEIEMLGFYHTLKWDTFNVVTADATDIPRKLLTTTSPSFTYNSGVFYDDSNTSRVDATTSFTAPGTRQAGESTWDMALKIVEASPSGNRYVCGISPTSPNTGERIAFFEAANETVEYAVDAYGDGRLTNLGGLPVNPWDVRPNRSILLRNILLGEAETFATGKIAWIKAINYDTESQTVSWETDDDTSLPGVFYLNTQEKATNVPMSAPRRQIVTDDYNVDSIVAGTADFDLLDVDNLRMDANSFVSTNSNGNILIVPNGTGSILLSTTAVISPINAGTNDGLEILSNGTIIQSRNNGTGAAFRRRTGNGTVILFFRDTTQVGDISVTTTNTAYNTSSDRRIKNSIIDASISEAVDRLKAIRVREFEFNVEPGLKHRGFIADELQAVAPEAVTGEPDAVEHIGTLTTLITDKDDVTRVVVLGKDEPAPEELRRNVRNGRASGKIKTKDGNLDVDWIQTGTRPVYQGVDASKLMPTVVAALQDALRRIEQLESRLAALETVK